MWTLRLRCARSLPNRAFALQAGFEVSPTLAYFLQTRLRSYSNASCPNVMRYSAKHLAADTCKLDLMSIVRCAQVTIHANGTLISRSRIPKRRGGRLLAVTSPLHQQPIQ